MTNLETKITELKNKIADLKVAIAESPWTMEEAEVASSISSDFYNNLETLDKDVFDAEAFFDSIAPMQLLTDTQTLEAFEHTLTQQLMYCPKKYVVTNDNEGLLSPAGFGIEDRVYIQTGLAIHVDDLNDVPSCNYTLYSNEIRTAY